MKLALLFLLLLLTGCGTVGSKQFNNQHQILNNGLILVDWAQTRQIPSSDNLKEQNQIIGSNPTTQSINSTFVISLVLYNTVNYFITDDEFKFWFNSIVTITELTAITENYSNGIRINF